MRILIVLLALLTTATAIAQTGTAPSSLEQSILGSWKSEDLGLDFLIWMVDTFAADGTVQIDFYSKPLDKEIHHLDKTQHGRWRIQNSSLEIGDINKNGEFEREGRAWPIKGDRSGKTISIAGWVRVTTPTTQPASKPSAGH